MATPIPPNEARFTLDEVASACGGRVISAGGPVCGVSTDTRSVRPGNLFVALRGESFDAHRFLGPAVSSGAAALLVSDASAVPHGTPAVVAPDTLEALGALGEFHRDRWKALGGERTIVAIGGSAGKTTTQRAVAALLQELRPGEVHATPGNLNGLVGVPVTLLLLEPRHRLAVVEVGTDHRGEVARLARLLRPDAALLTLIAPEHTQGIGSLEDVAAEEGDLLAALAPEGTALGNGDDPRVAAAVVASPARRRLLYGSAPGCAVRLLARTPAGARASRLTIADSLPGGSGERTEEIPLLGEAGACAALAAFLAARVVVAGEVPPGTLARALARVAERQDGRLVPLEMPDGTVVLDDTYNSNPGSLGASLRTARELADALGRRLVLILGEMRELGPLSEPEHRAAGRAAAAVAPAGLVAVTGDARLLHEEAVAAGVASLLAASSAEAVAPARELVRPGDVVLVKGSRGVRMEAIVAALTGGTPPQR